MHHPEHNFLKFLQDEEEGEIIINAVSAADIDRYNKILSDLRNKELFKQTYTLLINAEEYIIIENPIIDFENIQQMHKAKEGGSFNSMIKDIVVEPKLFLGIEIVPGRTLAAGTKENPYPIKLNSSLNNKLSKEDLGDGFSSAVTLFEEVFHAAHFLYLKRSGQYNENSFYSQTEVEVEFAKCFFFYLYGDRMGKDRKYAKFDWNGLLRVDLKNIIKEFDDIYGNVDDNVILLSKIRPIMDLLAKKKRTGASSYKNIDMSVFDYNCDFTIWLLSSIDKK